MATPNHDLTVVTMRIDELRPHPLNARQGDVERIAISLQLLGQYRPIVVNIGTLTGRKYEILAGHHLVKAAQRLTENGEKGWESVRATLVDVDDETAKRIMIVDNRTSDLATYDDRLLLELLHSLPNLDATGYDPGDLEALEAFLNAETPDHNDDDQDILDKSDASLWPEVRGRIRPELYKRWLDIPGDDDSERLVAVLDDIG